MTEENLDPTTDEPTDEAGLTPAQRRQLEKSARDATTELALYKAGLGELNVDQRAALLAVTGKDDLTPEALKAKAEALFGDQATQPPAGAPDPAAAQALGAEGRIADAASGSVPPPPPASKLHDLHEKVRHAPPGALAGLQAQAMEAIREAGLTIGHVEHDSRFAPLS